MVELNRVSVLSVQRTPTNDSLVRIQSSRLAQLGKPGHYVQCAVNEHAGHYMQAYLFSLNEESGIVDLFFQSGALKNSNDEIISDVLFISDPCGEHLNVSLDEEKPVLIADELGLPSIFFLADLLMRKYQRQPLVILSTEQQFPFTPKPSQFIVSDFPSGMLATCPLLEDKKIPARLISKAFQPGCYDGDIEMFFEDVGPSFWNEGNKIYYVAGRSPLLGTAKQYIEQTVNSAQYLIAL
ncbi:MAG: hypothetical protein OEM38_01075 [Gammaproteobacteria bacterium]|nr:hypothetical protein [Gammaproteobacteria bacterium]